MKAKKFPVIMFLILSVFVAGCGSYSDTPEAAYTRREINPHLPDGYVPSSNNSSGNNPSGNPSAGGINGLRLGIGSCTTLQSSKSTKDGANGLGESDTYIAAILIDKNGTILDCVIDCTQAKTSFSSVGALVTAAGTTFNSKNVLKEAYGMKKASSIGKEWYEQAAGMAQYLIGKNVDTVKSLEIVNNKATDVDLLSSTTIKINTIVPALIAAADSASACDAGANDKLGIAMYCDNAASVSASGSTAGKVIHSTVFCAVTTDASHAVTSCVLDKTVSEITFTGEGAVSSDTGTYVPSFSSLYGAEETAWINACKIICKNVLSKKASQISSAIPTLTFTVSTSQTDVTSSATGKNNSSSSNTQTTSITLESAVKDLIQAAVNNASER